jgi:hypothetical protein
MRLAKKGKILTAEHRKNISLGKLGENHHYYGKKRSIKTVQKMSEGAKLQWFRFKNLGYQKAPMTELTKIKKSKSIVLLDQIFNVIQKFQSTSLAIKFLKIGHIKLNSILDPNILLENKYYLKSFKI